MHFHEKSQAPTSDAREKAKFLGMAKKFQNPVFIKNLGLMYGALVELADYITCTAEGRHFTGCSSQNDYVDRLRYLLPGKTHQVTIMHRHARRLRKGNSRQLR